MIQMHISFSSELHFFYGYDKVIYVTYFKDKFIRKRLFHQFITCYPINHTYVKIVSLYPTSVKADSIISLLSPSNHHISCPLLLFCSLGRCFIASRYFIHPNSLHLKKTCKKKLKKK